MQILNGNLTDFFSDAIFIPEEYSGVKHLIIQDWSDTTYMINIDKEEKNIRVSYPDCQEVYSSYEEAYEKIKNHEKSIRANNDFVENLER